MTPSRPPLSRPEFIALMASLMAFVALSIDAMLPAMPEIAAELTPGAPNRAQLIVTSFVFGLGLGTLVVGPLSDAVGRRPIVAGGAALFVLAAALAWQAQSLEAMLAARFLQGVAASGARVMALAMIRDLYAGRQMAQLVSLVIVVFSLVPAIAPAMGAAVIALSGWRAIFGSFILFALVSAGWLLLRQPETLPVERRRPLRLGTLRAALAEIAGHRTVRLAIAAQALCFGMLFTMLSTTQPVFDVTFGQGAAFHWWFGGIAVVSATGGFLNSRIVMRLGMRRVVTGALIGELAVCAGFIALWLAAGGAGPLTFAGYLVWTVSVFFVAGLTLGNLNALALEPLGHIAGLASSVVSAVGTAGAALVAIPIGQTFDGTPLPIALGILALAALALALMRAIRRAEQRAGAG